jgi:hypothetical protein
MNRSFLGFSIAAVAFLSTLIFYVFKDNTQNLAPSVSTNETVKQLSPAVAAQKESTPDSFAAQVKNPSMTEALETIVDEDALKKAFPHQVIPSDVVKKAHEKTRQALEYGMIQKDETDSYLVANVSAQMLEKESENEQQTLSAEYQ